MKTKGIIFDIQRCSLYDGPGIRTTVFLKGCPLRCKWCHNPESQDYQPEIMFFEEKCAFCSACTAACKAGSHNIADGKHIYDRSRCEKCGLCVKTCPYEVLQWKGKELGIDEVLSEVEKDWDYYLNSGGGVTLSGGEPMAQFEFALALLSAVKTMGIHTCMETCGFAPLENFKRILSQVDIFLFDYKATNPEIHKELTGVTNDLILSNLDHIYSNGRPIILRCPLIPGVNDSDEHLWGIARLSDKYPNLAGIEIMAYHNMGISKAKRIGKYAYYAELTNTGEDQKAKWMEKLRQYGCDKAIAG